MSFKSLVNKLVKEGKSREAATKIAGKVANAKMKGAGSGPTAKQKARMKGSPAKADWKVVQKSKGAGGRKSKEVYKDGELVKSKSKPGRAYTNSGEYKTVTKEKLGKGSDKYKSKSTRKVKGGVYTQKDKVADPKRKSNRTIKEINTTSKKNKGTETYVKEKRKETIKKDSGSARKTKVKLGSYVNKGTGKRATINKSKEKTTPAKMKKQGYNARLDDSLGAKHGKKSQSLKSRRDESEGMEKSMKRRKFSGNKSSAQGSAAKFNKGLKKASADGKLDNNPKFKAAVDASPAKMNGKTLKKTTAKAKDTKGVKTVQPKRSKTLVKNIEKKIVTKKGVKTGSLDAAKSKRSKANAAAARKQGYMMNYNTGQYQATPNKRGAERRKESGLNRFQAYDQMDTRNAAQTAGSPMGMYGKHSPANAYGKSPMNAYGKSPMKMSHGKSPMKMKGKGGCAISKHMGGRR